MDVDLNECVATFLFNTFRNRYNPIPIISAEKRMDLMMPLFHLMMAKAPPTFPPPKGKTEDGLNFNLLEDIVVGIQARLFLYLACTETGRC